MTAALQARVEQHSMTHKSPTGTEPREPQDATSTPRRSPIVGKTPSPVRIDKNGDAWELEDDEAQEEKEKHGDEKEEDELTRAGIDRRACAGSISTEGQQESQ